MEQEESVIINAKLPCDNCGSSDAYHEYSDGHGYCFSCQHYVKGEGQVTYTNTKTPSDLLPYDSLLLQDMKKRNISEATCKKFGYYYTSDKKKQVAVYRNKDGKVIAHKLRDKNKNFPWLGNQKDSVLYGQHLWTGGKRLVITEGEIDCLSVAEMNNCKYPVVSVPNGAQNAKKALANQLDWLKSFDEIVLLFDMDKPGQDAASECAKLLSDRNVKIAKLPLKDANEMLVEGRGGEITTAIFNAQPYQPSGILELSTVLDDILKKQEWGLSWPWPSLTNMTYGYRRKEAYYLGAGVGIGKSDWARELAQHIVKEHDLPIGMFMLEEGYRRSGKSLVGKMIGKVLNRPDIEYDAEEVRQEVSELLPDKIYFYDHVGVKDWDDVKAHIRYLANVKGVKDFFLDPITALVSHLSSSEANDEINRIAGDIATLVHELDCTIFGFSHLNPPKQSQIPHERGGQVNELQFTGSRGLMRYGHYLFALERNKHPDLPDEEKNRTNFVLLKDREYGNTGHFCIEYNKNTGQYREPEGANDWKIIRGNPKGDKENKYETPEGVNDF